MNEVETTRLLAVIKSRYPQAALGAPEAAVAAWLLTLEDVPYAAAEEALRRWFRERRWAPDPSELRVAVLQLVNEAPDAADAWEMVLRHIRENGTIGGRAFSGPGPVVQAVAAAGGWRNLRTSDNPQRDRDAFIRAYEVYQRRAAGGDLAVLMASRGYAALPERPERPESLESLERPE
ncbi:MAG: hypothetical protein ACKOWF_18930 [Chloroflexota bacterium]